MKKTLILVRHATAEDQSFRIKDFERNLNSKGLSEALAMGKWLVQEQIKPDLFVSSPASRAFKTAEIIAEQYKLSVDAIRTRADLYDGGPKAYLQAVTTVPEEYSTVILFGHNPDITYFAEYLSGASIGSMKKGSAAFIGFKNRKWEEISAKAGDLILYKTPKQVREEE
ncbi:histidine phosphatase family protein [Dyadobacter sp. 676]|uniref:Histidine phosphatase family protein n=1 Tax=Dyadobacter sp. 676 TaxID=3088362 RepID=A0AAU8FEG5_9BACT